MGTLPLPSPPFGVTVSHQWTVVIISQINASPISKGLYLAKGVTMSCSVPCLFPLWLCLAWLHIPCRPSQSTRVQLQGSERFSLESLVSHTYKNMSFWGIYLRLLKYVKWPNSSVSVYKYIYICNSVSFHNNPLRHISVSLIHVEQISRCCSGTVSTNIHSRNHPLHQRWCDLNKSRRIPGGFGAGADQECMAYTLHWYTMHISLPLS